MAQHTKRKKRNIKGRKDPAFADMIMLMFRDSLITMEEMTEKKPNKEYDEATGRMIARYNEMPDGCIVVDSLNGHTLFKDERLHRHIDRIALALGEFGDEFRSEDGTSVHQLRVDKKNRVWGAEVAVLALAYLAIAAGLAEWTQPREEWNANEDHLPRIRFLPEELAQETAKEIYERIKADPNKISTEHINVPIETAGSDSIDPTSLTLS